MRMPKGISAEPRPPPPPIYNIDELAGDVADSLVSGKGALKPHTIRTVSEKDRQLFQRVTGDSVEKFNQMIAEKLGTIGSKVLEKIEAKLELDEFKTSELAFLYSVMHDKRQSVEGRAQVANAAINIQVNQYGTQVSKSDLIAMLEGRKVTDLPGAGPVEKAG